MLERLYKRTATGAIQVWDIEVDETKGRYRTISGQIEGAKITSEWTQCTAKNVGRANAVSVREQASREATASWEKKQRDGYSTTIDNAVDSEAFQCMLAKNYDDPLRKEQLLKAADKGVAYSQPKLDGIRLIASATTLMSRKNRPIVAVPHIAEALAPLFAVWPKLVIDGELYNHELKDDFDSLVSIVRKGKPKAEDFKAARTMQYWIYDCAGDSIQHLPFVERIGLISDLVHTHTKHGFGGPSDLRLVIVPTTQVRTESRINELYAEYLEAGYEGQMLRSNAPYENKRSDKLIKRKEFEDKEFVVLGIEEGIGNRSGQAGYAVLEHDGAPGAVFKAGIKAPLDKRVELLKQKHVYIGGDVTVRFNGRTPGGVPRFPRAVAWYPEGRSI